MQIKGVLANPYTQDFKACEVEITDYTSWYDILDCECIDIIELKIGDIWCDVIIDDEGKIKSASGLPSIVIYHNNRVYDLIMGKAFICAHNGHGGETSLTDEQLEMVLASVQTYTHGLEHTIYKMIEAKYE